MRALGVYHEEVIGKPYAFRFTGSPYNPFVEECRSLQVMTHNKGQTISPLNLGAILSKFEITEEAFFEQYDRLAEEGKGIDLDAAEDAERPSSARPN